MDVYNLNELIKKIKHDRYMGLIIFGEGNIGKTNYIKRFISKSNKASILLDIEEELSNKSDKRFIFTLTPPKFVDWIMELINQKSKSDFDYVIVDHIDIVINLWSNNKVEEFIKRVQKIEKSYFSKPVIVFLQSDDITKKLYNCNDDFAFPKIIKFSSMEEI